MWRRFSCAAALCGVVVSHAYADTLWTGSNSDSWFDAGNWDNGVPHTAGERAQIESSTDFANWPVIKSGETVDMGERIFLPAGPAGVGQTSFGRLTVESGGVLNVDDDFRAGDDDGFADRPMVGSFVVVGDVTFSDTARFGDNEFMTLIVDVTGSMISTADDEDFRVGTGDDSNVTFNISGAGLVSVAGPFEMDAGGLLTLSGDGTLRLSEYTIEDEDDLGNPIFIPVTKADLIDLMADYAADGLVKGLTNSYSGGEALTGLGNGVAYFEGSNSLSFVSVPEPTALYLSLFCGLAVASHRLRRVRSLSAKRRNAARVQFGGR